MPSNIQAGADQTHGFPEHQFEKFWTQQLTLRIEQETNAPNRTELPSPRFSALGFGFDSNTLGGRYLLIMYPCAILLSAALAIAPWLRWRFSLRTLLIATMVFAIVLELGVLFRR